MPFFGVLLLAAMPIWGAIVHFANTDNASKHYHVHTDTMFAAPGPGSRPYISFEVSCESPNTIVSWLIVASNVNGLARSLQVLDPALPALDDPDANKFMTDRCWEIPITNLNLDRNESMDTHLSADENPSNISFGEAECHPNSVLLYMPARVPRLVGGSFQCDVHAPHFVLPKEISQVITEDGYYTLWIQSAHDPALADDYLRPGPRISGTSTFVNWYGYLSARLYPLLVFYGVLGLLYLTIGLIWVVLMFCHYHDLLHLQFWIGGVAFLGMMEMAISYGDLEYLNTYGTRSTFWMVFANLLFASKNTLARLLVLIVSMGFGVVKPRLGSALKQIIALGCSYFFFAAAYGVTHAIRETDMKDMKESKTEMIVVIPLSVLDAGICWWIFLSLHHTMKILTLRNNLVKLQLYIYFKWTLILCITAAVIFAVWSLVQGYGKPEDYDWRSQWWLDNYWHLLFFVILVAIMLLWRPTMNNSRYAYAAMDTDLEEETEFNMVVPNFSADAMKSRTLSARGHAAAPKEDLEEDLQWVEDNIPSSVVNNDNTFPNFPMDSDEEIMQTRFEMSKMD